MKTKIVMTIILLSWFLLTTWMHSFNFDFSSWDNSSRVLWSIMLFTVLLLGAISPSGMLFKDEE